MGSVSIFVFYKTIRHQFFSLIFFTVILLTKIFVLFDFKLELEFCELKKIQFNKEHHKMPKKLNKINKKDLKGWQLPPRPRRAVHARALDPKTRSVWRGANLLDQFVQCWRVAPPEARALLEQHVEELLKALYSMKNKGS